MNNSAKIASVTGGVSCGLGRAIVEALAQRGVM